MEPFVQIPGVAPEVQALVEHHMTGALRDGMMIAARGAKHLADLIPPGTMDGPAALRQMADALIQAVKTMEPS